MSSTAAEWIIWSKTTVSKSPNPSAIIVLEVFLMVKNNRKTWVTRGLHFVRLYFLFTISSAFSAKCMSHWFLSNSLCMMQDWRETALQFHSAGEHKLASPSCCSSSKPLEGTTIKASVSHQRAQKHTWLYINGNAMMSWEQLQKLICLLTYSVEPEIVLDGHNVKV